MKTQDNCEDRTAVINVTHGMQVGWASAVERLASVSSDNRLQFKEMLDEIKARNKDGKRYHEDFIPELKNLIASNMQ